MRVCINDKKIEPLDNYANHPYDTHKNNDGFVRNCFFKITERERDREREREGGGGDRERERGGWGGGFLLLGNRRVLLLKNRQRKIQK